MKKRVRLKSRGKKKNLIKDYSNRILILFSLIILMLIISMTISFLAEGFYKDTGVSVSNQAGLGSLGVFKIDNPYPNGSMVSFFVGENRTFNISNTNYQRIEWYLDEKNINNDSRALEIRGAYPGNHTLEVRIINGSQVDSRIWKIEIFDYEKQIKFVFDTGSIMFWVILIILLLIMGMLIWLLIKEYGKRKRRIKLNLQVIGEDQSSSGFSKKTDMSKRFNIPRS